MSKALKHEFRLYVAGDAPNSVLAASNLRALCQEHLPRRHQIEIVDVTRQPQRALAESILVTPMLVCHGPGGERRIIGNLSNRHMVLQLLGLEAAGNL